MNARRFPRTMDQAFGPYQRSSQCVIEPMADQRAKTSRADIALYFVGVIGAIAAIVWNNFGA